MHRRHTPPHYYVFIRNDGYVSASVGRPRDTYDDSEFSLEPIVSHEIILVTTDRNEALEKVKSLASIDGLHTDEPIEALEEIVALEESQYRRRTSMKKTGEVSPRVLKSKLLR
jgi:hypothetical protein